MRQNFQKMINSIIYSGKGVFSFDKQKFVPPQDTPSLSSTQNLVFTIWSLSIFKNTKKLL